MSHTKNKSSRLPGIAVMQEFMNELRVIDLMKTFVHNSLDDTAAEKMSEDMIRIHPDEKALCALELIGGHGCSLLHVIDNDGLLVGSITEEDINKGILIALENYIGGDDIRKYRAGRLFDDIISDSTSLTLRYKVAPKDFEIGGKASSTMKRMLERIGIDADLLKRITISAYEAEMNLIIHTNEGGEIRAEINPECIVLTAEDSGPGIEDVEEALRPGFSTAPDWVRSLGFGAGMGLCNIKRYSDEISLVSETGKGTVLTAAFKIQPSKL